MRIISGKHKGRRIVAPKKLPIRPTTDLAKESLFNILNNYYDFDELKVLDLFAGSGNISYEFASRGTKDITSVDSDLGCTKFIQQTSDALDLNIKSVKTNVFLFLEKLQTQYDIIFADPPYEFSQEDFEKIPKLIFKNEILTQNGMLVIEHSSDTNFENLEHFWYKRKYGGSVFSFFTLDQPE